MSKNYYNYFNLIVAIVIVVLLERNNATSIDRIIIKQCTNCNETSYQFFNLTMSSDTMIMQVPKSSSFFIVQVHNYLRPVTLSYSIKMNRTNSVNGTNVGLNQIITDKEDDIFYLFHDVNDTRILVAVTSYSDLAPMPGGCNMEFDTRTAPYQVLKYNDDIITEEIQSASVSNKICDLTHVKLDFYHMFLDFNETPIESYYAAILKMLTPQDIAKHGKKVVEPIEGSQLRRLYSNYNGFGAVYNVIASYEQSGCAYVPGFSYGCSMDQELDICMNGNKAVTLKQVVNMASLLMLITSTKIAPLVPILNLGYYSSNMPILKEADILLYVLIVIEILFGIFVLRNKQLGNILMGFYVGHILTACIFVGMAMGENEIVQIKWVFWFLYFSVVILTTLIFPMLMKSSIYLAMIYHCLLFVDFLIGNGIFLYININTLRRASVENFNLAVIHSPNPSILPPIITIIIIGLKLFLNIKGKTRNSSPELQPLL